MKGLGIHEVMSQLSPVKHNTAHMNLVLPLLLLFQTAPQQKYAIKYHLHNDRPLNGLLCGKRILLMFRPRLSTEGVCQSNLESLSFLDSLALSL